MKTLLLTVFAIGLSACAVVQRHNASGYATAEEAEESGIDYENYRSLPPEERQKLDEQMAVGKMERQLRTTEERKQYNRYKSSLESDRERMEFLSLDGLTARERYLQSKGYTTTPTRYARDVASLIESSDIAVGMEKQAVLESWGDPAAVEYSGRPEMGNERWRYIEYIATPEGYQEEQRVLYFEKGRLVGWEKY